MEELGVILTVTFLFDSVLQSASAVGMKNANIIMPKRKETEFFMCCVDVFFGGNLSIIVVAVSVTILESLGDVEEKPGLRNKITLC